MNIESLVYNHVADQLPDFNDYLIRGLRKNEVNGLLDFIIDMYEEAIKLFWGDVEITNVSKVSPHDRLKMSMKKEGNFRSVNSVNVYIDHAELIRIEFTAYDRSGDSPIPYKTFDKHLLIPYLVDDSNLLSDNKRSHLPLQMSERIFWVNKEGDGITTNVVKVIPQFYAKQHCLIKSLTREKEFGSTLVTTEKMYIPRNEKPRKNNKPTIPNYLLAKFGLRGTLTYLGYDPKTIQYADKIGKDTDEYDYFKAQNTPNDPMMLKVAHKDMEDDMIVNLVISMVQSMGKVRRLIYDDFVNDDIFEWLILLANCLYSSNYPRESKYQYMKNHIESVDNFLDAHYREIFKADGVDVEDMYDLLVYIWTNINSIIIKYPNNDMYNKRVECIRSLILKSFFEPLYLNIYRSTLKDNPDNAKKIDIIGKCLRPDVNPNNLIVNLMKASPHIKKQVGMYNDNWLLCAGLTVNKDFGLKDPPLSLPVFRFHPSMMVVESVIGFSNNNPSGSFIINPMTEITETGSFVHNETSREADELCKYLK